MSISTYVRSIESTRVAVGPCPIITSNRLVMRPHQLSDAGSITQSLSDFAVSRMLARVPQPFDRQAALDWLQLQISGSLPDWTLAITMGNDLHIGVVSLERRKDMWHLGYWLNRDNWGKGIMTEAVGAVLGRFISHAPETGIQSGAFADNTPSLKIQQKLGFRITDCIEVFSMSRNRMVPHIETILHPEDFQRL